MSRRARRHPEAATVDPAVCDRTPPPASRSSRSLGGIAAAANMTPEARRERARKAAAARWEKEDARRAAEGEPPTKKTPKPLPDDELDQWCLEVDRRFGADYPWRFPSDRKRQAVALAREAAARRVAEAMRIAKANR